MTSENSLYVLSIDFVPPAKHLDSVSNFRLESWFIQLEKSVWPGHCCRHRHRHRSASTSSNPHITSDGDGDAVHSKCISVAMIHLVVRQYLIESPLYLSMNIHSFIHDSLFAVHTRKTLVNVVTSKSTTSTHSHPSPSLLPLSLASRTYSCPCTKITYRVWP